MEASRDLFVVPDARGHEYIRVGKNGVRAKLGIDATIPVDEKDRFARCEFLDIDPGTMSVSSDAALLRTYLGR
jgi:2,5-furandicarboxylate decarboxylase 1